MDNIWLIFGLILGVLLVSTMGQEQECEEQQFSQTRINYENCASKKIHEITSWLQREELEGEVKEEGVTAVCMASKPNPSKSVTEPSTTAATDPKQDEEILRNIEAIREFTTPTSTVSVSKSALTTPVITPRASTTTTRPTTTIVVSKTNFPTPATTPTQKATTTKTTLTTLTTTTTETTTTTDTTTTPETITTTETTTTTSIPTTTTTQTTTISNIEITTNTPQRTTATTKTSTTSKPVPSPTTLQTKSSRTQIILRERLDSSATATTVSTLVSSTTTISTIMSSTTTVSTMPSKSTFHDFDTGTTHSPVEPFKCEEKEFTETRDNYERCASNKIREITAWLERKERRRRRRRRTAEEEDSSILTVCNAVRQLLYDCGNELGWCFTEDQVSETRFKQREGLETILSKHYTPEKLEMCFMQENTPELVNISQVVDNQTEKNTESGKTGSRDTVPASEDISENIISDSSDRHPRVFPSTKKSSTSRVKTSSFLQFFILIISVAIFT